MSTTHKPHSSSTHTLCGLSSLPLHTGALEDDDDDDWQFFSPLKTYKQEKQLKLSSRMFKSEIKIEMRVGQVTVLGNNT